LLYPPLKAHFTHPQANQVAAQAAADTH